MKFLKPSNHSAISQQNPLYCSMETSAINNHAYCRENGFLKEDGKEEEDVMKVKHLVSVRINKRIPIFRRLVEVKQAEQRKAKSKATRSGIPIFMQQLSSIVML